MVDTAGLIAIIATCFFIPLSTSLMDMGAALVLVFLILSGRFLALPAQIFRQPVALLATLLFAQLAIGLIYSPADLRHSLEILAKYRELLYIPIIMTMVANNDNAARYAVNSFISGCIVLMTASFAMYFSLLPAMKYGNSLLFHITHSYFMAILAFCALQRVIDSRQYRYFWMLILAAATANIVIVNPGRTGMIVFIALMLLALVQRCSRRNLLLGLALLVVVLSSAYSLSSNFSTRAKEALVEIEQYQPGRSRSSLGMRFDWYINSIDLIKKAPYFGHGTGSFAIQQKKLVRARHQNTARTDNPHNEYLFIAVQVGLAGLLTYLLLLAGQFFQSYRLSEERRYLLQGVVVAMVTGCLMNSFLFDSHQGHFYAFISAALGAAGQQRKEIYL